MKLKHTCGTEEIWGRYGASLINSPWGILLMGGIGVDMIGRRDEILVLGGDWSVSRLNLEVTGPRPLLVGAQAMSTDGNEVLIVGGGAVCFSFGTVWNEGCYSLSVEPSNEPHWELLTPSTNGPLSNVPSESVEILEAGGVNKDRKRKPKEPKKVSRKVVASAEDFDKILTKGRPVIMDRLDIGKCTEAWSTAYLKERVGIDRKVWVALKLKDKGIKQSRSWYTPPHHRRWTFFLKTSRTPLCLLDSSSTMLRQVAAHT